MVPHGELYVAQRRRGQDLPAHELTGAQALDELGELALGTQTGAGSQPATKRGNRFE